MRFHQYLKGSQLGNGLGKEKLQLRLSNVQTNALETLGAQQRYGKDAENWKILHSRAPHRR
jgi:hypothetical protein